jgi:hypothetical protein
MHGDSTNIDRHVLPTVGGLDPTDRDRDTRRARHIDRLLTAGALERCLSRQVPTVRRHHGGHSVTSGLIRTRPLRNLAAFAASADRETAGLHSALRSTEPEGTCTSTAIYFADTPLPLLDMYTRGITFRTGERASGDTRRLGSHHRGPAAARARHVRGHPLGRSGHGTPPARGENRCRPLTQLRVDARCRPIGVPSTWCSSPQARRR